MFEHWKICEEKHKLPHDKLGRVIIAEAKKKAAKTFKTKVQMGIAKYNNSHPHTKESKKKISEGRKRCLREGRDNHWICPAIKRSYAEQYFYDCFVNEHLEFENNKWINHYCVDFLFKNKYYFEVDGEQHFTNESIEHDKERDVFLKEKGFVCIGRCRWKTFKSLEYEQKRNYILELVTKIQKLIFVKESV